MPKALSYASFQRAVGRLSPGGRAGLSYTKQGGLWKDGFFCVASETWFSALSQEADFTARSVDIRARLERDRINLQHVEASAVDQPDGLTFSLFAETLVR